MNPATIFLVPSPLTVTSLFVLSHLTVTSLLMLRKLSFPEHDPKNIVPTSCDNFDKFEGMESFRMMAVELVCQNIHLLSCASFESNQ